MSCCAVSPAPHVLALPPTSLTRPGLPCASFAGGPKAWHSQTLRDSPGPHGEWQGQAQVQHSPTGKATWARQHHATSPSPLPDKLETCSIKETLCAHEGPCPCPGRTHVPQRAVWGFCLCLFSFLFRSSQTAFNQKTGPKEAQEKGRAGPATELLEPAADTRRDFPRAG